MRLYWQWPSTIRCTFEEGVFILARSRSQTADGHFPVSTIVAVGKENSHFLITFALSHFWRSDFKKTAHFRRLFLSCRQATCARLLDFLPSHDDGGYTWIHPMGINGSVMLSLAREFLPVGSQHCEAKWKEKLSYKSRSSHHFFLSTLWSHLHCQHHQHQQDFLKKKKNSLV